jgi:hypothetical protein
MPTALDAISTSMLEGNLSALGGGSRGSADLIRRTPPHPEVTFIDADDEGLSGTIGPGASARQLASRRRPLDEAARFAAGVPIESAGVLIVMGFGMGHHVAALARRIRRTGAIIVFEPDAALLRAVLDRVDLAEAFRQSTVVLLTDADDSAALSSAMRGIEGLVALGVKFVDHPPSMPRLGSAAERFRKNVAAAVAAVKTAVVTTLVQSDVTIRNLLMNLDRYAIGPGIADLTGAASGRPAIVVSAGPSLRRNVELLARPGVRDRFVVIAAQTVLRTLLERGIRPHFVTALDHHEISRRFYEGLTAEDVEGVALVVEAKANPAILDSFPGTIRCVGDEVLDDLLGPELARPMGSVPPGATVAHLAYTLARHLGCDPVILVGQDLGFTDGQYYSAGAAIHRVWSAELNPFNTLEMMEWQRIVRGRATLRTAKDVLGRPIYTDEQMAAYLAQFERDFLADASRGLRIVDATEGGVAKAHAASMSLADAISAFDPAVPLSLPPPPEPRESRSRRLSALVQRLRAVRADTWTVTERCRLTASKLAEMREHHADQQRVNRLIGQVERIRDEVTALQPAFRLVDRMNQVGVLNRFRDDRGIELDPRLSPMERQRRQIERDIRNVTWLGDAADQLGRMLDDAVRCLEGAPKTTRDPSPTDAPGSSAVVRPNPCRIIKAVIPADARFGGLGSPRPLDCVLHAGMNALRLTLARLARCTRLDGVVLLCEDVETVRRLVGTPPQGLTVEYAPVAQGALSSRAASMRGSRGWAAPSWRGGLGFATAFDEAIDPAVLAPMLTRLGIHGAVCLGPDWCLVDPALVDSAVERYLENPERHRLTFVQAPPGLGACVIDRGLAEDLASRPDAGVFATAGAALGYVPVQPMPDPIARAACVTVPPSVRDAPYRFVADSRRSRAFITRILAGLGRAWESASAEKIAAAARETDATTSETMPRELILELCTGRRTSGPRGDWLRGSVEPVERAPIPWPLAARAIREHSAERDDALLTLFGAGDPLLHPELPRIVAAGKAAGATVHVRTDLVAEHAVIDALIEAGPDVISVDLMAETAQTYRGLMGADVYHLARGNLERLLHAQGKAGGLPVPWIVPRITRCDATYAEIEPFFDRWTLAAGAAVIDALPDSLPGQRIEPLPRPTEAARRMWRERLLILCDGSAPASERDLPGERPVGDVTRDGLAGTWRRVVSHRERVARDHGPAHPDLWTGW